MSVNSRGEGLECALTRNVIRMASSTEYVDYEFPVDLSDCSASVDYGQFLAFLESEMGKVTCLQQGTYKLTCLHTRYLQDNGILAV